MRLIALFGSLVLVSGPASAVSIVASAPATTEIGDQITIVVGLDELTAIEGYELFLSWDGTALEYQPRLDGTGAVLGFLVFNFPPARLFMGDVGSGVLGLLTGALALTWWQQDILYVVPSLILLAGFWLDASYTLIVRALTGQPFTQAHRLHLYQKVATTRGHLWTTVAFLTYASLWLLPLAWLSARFPEQPDFTTWLWLLPAAVPLLLCAWWFRAGFPVGPGDRHD